MSVLLYMLHAVARTGARPFYSSKSNLHPIRDSPAEMRLSIAACYLCRPSNIVSAQIFSRRGKVPAQPPTGCIKLYTNLLVRFLFIRF